MSENGNKDPLSTIQAAHSRIDAWFETTRSALANDEATSACAQLREVLETHFAQEEELYFPTLWQLRPDQEKCLRGLIATHAVYLGKVDKTVEFIGAGRPDDAVACFEELQKLFAAHEVEEEQTLRDMR
ncbi:MAG: hemerythrin domain-containing protein [Deltaproteobacteria bacterium]|nr:hemerythrin domain-containing protein [Deltaproteobacteria bacterium]MBW2398637.1 hemerythrin domain-containing protein [Deltaproteobacteria bacterium]